eukprot:m.3714 g.3714  ORF g.3714 m.3714 type:complete len:75 (+) comp3716_c0_seq1:1275-1499(+)
MLISAVESESTSGSRSSWLFITSSKVSIAPLFQKFNEIHKKLHTKTCSLKKTKLTEKERKKQTGVRKKNYKKAM